MSEWERGEWESNGREIDGNWRGVKRSKIGYVNNCDSRKKKKTMRCSEVLMVVVISRTAERKRERM